MNNSKIKLLKNIHFRGDLNGTYQASPIVNTNNDSKISLIETTISKTEICSELDFFNQNQNILEYTKVEDVTIKLADNKDLQDYRFVEDITNLKICDVSLSDQIKDGTQTFGVIQGNAMFTLKKEEELKIDKFKTNDNKFKDEENKILAKRNLISKEEINKELKLLQVKFQKYRKEKSKEIDELKVKRNKNIINFLNLINPIIEKYMADNSIYILLDKKNIFIASKDYDITNNLIELIDNQIKTIEIK